MSAFQIPQFIDSGDKILWGMNVRQFGYFLVGLFGSFVIYAILESIFPDAGFWLLFLVAPIFLFFGYLAVGKYNGRDVEIYVFKLIIFFLKPRVMKFVRNPDNQDLDERMSELTPDKIQKKWQQYLAQEKAVEEDVTTLENIDRSEKVAKIMKLTRSIEDPVKSAAYFAAQKEIKLKSIQIDLENIERQKMGLPPLPKPFFDQNTTYQATTETNFFKEGDE